MVSDLNMPMDFDEQVILSSDEDVEQGSDDRDDDEPINSNKDVEQDSDDCDDDEQINSNEDVDQDSSSGSPSIRSELEKRLEVGSKVESLDQVYLLYCLYARCMGFKARKGSQSYFRNSTELKMKVYDCSCEGLSSEDMYNVWKFAHHKRKVSTKTDCKARLRVARESEQGLWTVSVFNKEHNHELIPPDQSSLLRSSINVPVGMLDSDGIGVSHACRFMGKESGGPKNVGFTQKAESSHTSRLRKHTKLDNSDADSILHFLSNKSKEELYFYWDVQLDDDGKLMSFFFRDYQCLADYEFFGDVLSVDATYKIKKNGLICVPFVGINHHREKVMFGLACLSDETTESFEWLLQTFMKSMHGKEPQLIFSNQCEALMNGIDNTFRIASHRINLNASSHFGSLNGNDEFKKTWQHCMNGCETEDEFEKSWQVMIETFDLSGHTWFGKMYNLRRKWASVFTNDRFSAGLRASPHSKILKGLCSSSNSLYEFMLETQQLQADWRTMEAEEEARTMVGIPGQSIENNGWLMHAAHVYTRNMYKRFENEVRNLLTVKVIQDPNDSISVEDLVFDVVSSSVSPTTRGWRVNFSTRTHRATCTCHMWETEGILCRHIMRIYCVRSVMKLPEQCIIKRWTRRAKVRDHAESYTRLRGRDMAPDERVNYTMRESYDMLMESKRSLKLRSLINEHMVCLVMEFNAMTTKDATFASPVQGFMDGQTEPQSEVEKMGPHLQLNQSFFDGQDYDFQASKKTCSSPNARCDTSQYGGVKGKGQRKLA